MARTLDEGFSTFHSWLTPTATETTSAKNHRASIEACIKSEFGLYRFFRTGSFGNGTSISGYSDVDYFASIPRDQLKENSNSTLIRLKNALDARFPRTGVRIGGPAVVVPFGTDASETTEVVPVDYLRQELSESLYHMPDGFGGWKYSSPELHKYYVDHYNEKLSSKLKPLIRFIKAWKFYQSVPVSSFYLEMFTAKYASGETTIVYDIDIKAVFSRLKAGNFPALDDPYGVTGTISPFSNAADRIAATEKIEKALERAEYARTAESEKRTEDAFYWWDRVYNGKFPAY
jgi:hypothetical protein